MVLAERQAAHRMQTESDDMAHRSRLKSKIIDAAIRSEPWDQRRSRELRCPAGWHTALRRHAHRSGAALRRALLSGIRVQFGAEGTEELCGVHHRDREVGGDRFC
jgi:hypothetical protein